MTNHNLLVLTKRKEKWYLHDEILNVSKSFIHSRDVFFSDLERVIWVIHTIFR